MGLLLAVYPADSRRSPVKEGLQVGTCGTPRFQSAYAAPNLPTQPYMPNLALLAVPPPKAAGSRFWSLKAPGFGLCSSLRADTPTSEAAARRSS